MLFFVTLRVPAEVFCVRFCGQSATKWSPNGPKLSKCWSQIGSESAADVNRSKRQVYFAFCDIAGAGGALLCLILWPVGYRVEPKMVTHEGEEQVM